MRVQRTEKAKMVVIPYGTPISGSSSGRLTLSELVTLQRRLLGLFITQS